MRQRGAECAEMLVVERIEEKKKSGKTHFGGDGGRAVSVRFDGGGF